MDFQRRRAGLKRWSTTNVDDSVVVCLAPLNLHGINAITRQNFLLRDEISRRETKLTAPAISMDHFAIEGEISSENFDGIGNSSLSKDLSDRR